MKSPILEPRVGPEYIQPVKWLRSFRVKIWYLLVHVEILPHWMINSKTSNRKKKASLEPCLNKNSTQTKDSIGWRLLQNQLSLHSNDEALGCVRKTNVFGLHQKCRYEFSHFPSNKHRLNWIKQVQMCTMELKHLSMSLWLDYYGIYVILLFFVFVWVNAIKFNSSSDIALHFGAWNSENKVQ